jgi:predicted AAA+ superfamily ATPase
LNGFDYRPRIVDSVLQQALDNSGAVQLVGPKWCGKTTTAERLSNQAVYFQDPDERDNYLRVAEDRPSILLQGERPLLLDEWQDAPKMWDAVRFAVDREKKFGQFILTGSAVPDDKEIKHSGTGRIASVHMRTMSLYESGESNGTVSLAMLLEQTGVSDSKDVPISGQGTLGLDDVARAMVRGGWPASTVNTGADLSWQATQYIERIIDSDISRVDKIEKNPRRTRLLMRSLARNESTEAAMTTLQADMAADDGKLSTNTIAQYLGALRRLYILDEQEAWAPAVRSKVTQRTSPVRRYCDPSLAAALLRLTPEKLLTDYNTFGLLFESLCIRDLRCYAQANDAEVYHYRDARGLECDAIVECGDGSWGAVEIKLESSRIEQAVETLLRIKSEVHSQHGGGAKFLVVITSGGYAYQRDDGICIIPITCLRH